MLLPRLPLLDKILKAPGIYRTEGARIQRRLFAGVWYDAAHCATPAEAERIAAQLNAL
jgi:hypothetical protein